jgi:DNA-binding GntR family transcriptional regulator
MQLALTHWESRARQEHRAIAAAVRKREVVKATRLLRDHILTAGRSLVTFLEAERAPRGNTSKVSSRSVTRS